MSERKFAPLTHMNVDAMYTSGFLEKGTLVKYRNSTVGILEYGLSAIENEWCFGIISETHWYINMSIVKAYQHNEKECVCYDLSVHNVAHGTREMINIELYEILILISE